MTGNLYRIKWLKQGGGGSGARGAGPGRARGAARPAMAVLAVLAALVFALPVLFGDTAGSQDEQPLIGGGYAGSRVCKDCHEKQFERYRQFSLKSDSYKAIEKMQDGLTEEDLQQCYGCHTTGYGKRTGFESLEKTPHLKNVGCEACHGPGQLHTETMDMAHIVKTVTIDVCEKCHVNPNVKSFRYKSVIYAGAH